jgi:hypothetical protein
MADPGRRFKDEPTEHASGPNQGAQDLADLRSILVGPDRRRVDALEARIDDPEARARDVGDVLPRVLLQHAQDPHFARAMAPPLEKALTASVRRDPKPLADALFPVMGPAIRKAVAAALAGMTDSLNRTLEHSLSWKSIQWRIEARRTGRTFGEVLLVKTLVYRVEQVFLIDRRTGLLLQHVHHGGDIQDADMVSSMLTAIRDFVQDSFKVADTDSLEALKVGDLSVWIEPGPHAVVAAVIRGSAPREYRQRLTEAVESIHLQFADALEQFKGDASTLEDARPVLEGCVDVQFRPEESKRRSGAVRILAGVAAVLVLSAGVVYYRAQARWTSYLSALKSEPGLVVLETSRGWFRHIVGGLRDPLARDPAALVAASGLSADSIDARWAPYYSLDPGFVVRRATSVLRPPTGVTLTVADGVLRANGAAPLAWVTDTVRVAPLVPGVARFDAASALEARLRGVTAAVDGVTIHFGRGSAIPVTTDRSTLVNLATNVRELNELAAALAVRYRIDEGTPEANLRLSRARAATVVAAVGPEAVSRIIMSVDGVGSREPAVPTAAGEDNPMNRRVTIRVGPAATE